MLDFFKIVSQIEYMALTFLYLTLAIKFLKLMKVTNNGVRALKKALFIVSASSCLTFGTISLSMIFNFYEYQFLIGIFSLIGVYFIYTEMI